MIPCARNNNMMILGMSGVSERNAQQKIVVDRILGLYWGCIGIMEKNMETTVKSTVMTFAGC